MAERPISKNLKVEDGSAGQNFTRVKRGHQMTIHSSDGKILGGELNPLRPTKVRQQAPKKK